MPPQADLEVRRLHATYAATLAAVRRRVQLFTRNLWASLPGYDEPDIDRFTATIVPVVRGGQRQVANLTDAYLATMARLVLGAGTLTGVPDAVLDAIRPVPPAEAYRRAGVTVWAALAAGAAYPDAVGKGGARAESTAVTDLQLAATHASRHVLTADRRATGYRRVTNGRCCDLCEQASDRIYRTGDLLPIHNRCTCTVEPVYRAEDPGEVPGGEVTDDRGRPAVREHGELGPVLVVAGQQFTGPDDI